MARILLTVPPLTGHIHPLLPVAARLQRRGHEVAWAGHEATLDQHIPASDRRFALPAYDSDFVESNTHRVRGLASVKFFYEHVCLPMAGQCLAPLEEIVRKYRPGLLLCDHQMLAGALVARKLDLVWASSITTTAPMLRSPGPLERWLGDRLYALQAQYGLEAMVERPDFSPYACLVFSSRALVGEEQPCFDAPYQYVGPVFDRNRRPVDFPWQRLDPDKRKILVSLGTVSRDRSRLFYQAVLDAFAGSDLQVVMVAPPELAVGAPDNFIVQPRVPQLDLLAHVDLVVCHAGHNTVCETLAHGKPMVVAPIRDDQPVIAGQVVNAGAGVGVRFGKVTADGLRKAVLSVLSDDACRLAAGRIRESFAQLGGERAACDVLESLPYHVAGGKTAGTA